MATKRASASTTTKKLSHLSMLLLCSSLALTLPLTTAQYQNIELIRNSASPTFDRITANTTPANPSPIQANNHHFQTQQLNLGNLGSALSGFTGGTNPLSNLGNLGNIGAELGNFPGSGSFPTPSPTSPTPNPGSGWSDLIKVIDGSDGSGVPLADRLYNAGPKIGNSTNASTGDKTTADVTVGSGAGSATPKTTDPKSTLISTSPTGAADSTIVQPIPVEPDTTAPSEDLPSNPNPTTPTNPTNPSNPGGGNGTGNNGGGSGIDSNVPLDPGSRGDGGVINTPPPGRSNAQSLLMTTVQVGLLAIVLVDFAGL